MSTTTEQYALTIYAREDVDFTGAERHTPPCLVVGSYLTIDLMDDDGITIWYNCVEVTESNAATADALVAELLAASGYALTDDAIAWTPSVRGMKGSAQAQKR